MRACPQEVMQTIVDWVVARLDTPRPDTPLPID
jgi:hypothetical protein